MFGRFIRNGVRSVQAETVDMKFPDPVDWVLSKKASYGTSLSTIEIECRSPGGFVGRIKVPLGIHAHVVAVGSEVVVNHVQKDRQTGLMCGVHKFAQVLRRAVNARGRIDRDTVVTPVPVSREVRDRHQFNGSDPDLFEMLKSLD